MNKGKNKKASSFVKNVKQIRRKMANNKSPPVNVYILVLLTLFQGLSGVLGGVGLVLDPTGDSLQIPVSWLHGSPFNDYFIPGLILLTVLGFFPLVVAYGLWKQLSLSWSGALIVGAALITWVGVEILIIGYQAQPPLQFIYGSIGLLILVLVLTSSVRRYYKNGRIS